ncbi:MAG: TonB-dependent receptor, partial [Bacteroidales bacterium]|nr:TonB-dependent receptor [Bacteroidales bacterium]
SDLMPYQTSEWEIGADLRFFNNRVGLDYAYYDKLTENDIVSVSLPSSSGYNGATVNLGKMSNKGHEIMLNLVPMNGNFKWDMTMTYSRNKSEVLDLGGVSELQLSRSEASTTIKQIVGQPFASIVGYRQAVDETTGQKIWYWNASRKIWFPQRTATPEILGTGINPNAASFSTTFRFKGVTLNAMIDAKWGAKVFSYSEWDMTARGHSERTVEFRESGIPIEGVYKNGAVYETITTNTNIPYTGNNFENYYRYAMGNTISDYNLFDASFVKFRQISVGYSLPKSVLKGLPMQDVSFTLVGRNLFDIYNGLPNGDASTSGTSGNAFGIERFALPATRSYTLNVNVTF